MIRPPNPRIEGMPGWVRTSSLQTSTIDAGSLGLSLLETNRVLRRSRLLQPQAAINPSTPQRRQPRGFLGTEKDAWPGAEMTHDE